MAYDRALEERGRDDRRATVKVPHDGPERRADFRGRSLLSTHVETSQEANDHIVSARSQADTGSDEIRGNRVQSARAACF